MTVTAPAEARPAPVMGAALGAEPDERLAALAGEGNQPAFEELVRRYRSRLVAFAAGIGPPSSADDVVQDAMLKAHLALARGDGPDCPKAWLFQIVRNTALNHRRAWRAHALLDETIDGVEQPQQAAERLSRLRSLVSGLRALPASQREAIVQRELEGRGHDEIAGALGVSAGAVRQLIHRARETLRAGATAFVPTSLLRLLTLPGAAEPAAGGLGAGAAKLGIGTVIAVTAFAGSARLAERVDEAAGRDGAATVLPASKTASPRASRSAETAPASADAARPRELVRAGGGGLATSTRAEPSPPTRGNRSRSGEVVAGERPRHAGQGPHPPSAQAAPPRAGARKSAASAPAKGPALTEGPPPPPPPAT